ncbi:MAG: hypothetical protein IT236_03215 [Bacteroidia bacterium]|nr:hypothetical protein [Bacteroidia bacterium]
MENNLAKARDLFNVAHLSNNECERLLELTNNCDDAVLKSYHAAGLMISSKYLFNPVKVISVFNKGKALLEDLVSENFEAPEIRFIRYTIQLNTPRFVGYFKNIEADRKLLNKFLKSNQQPELSAHMMIFLKNTNDELLKQLY